GPALVPAPVVVVTELDSGDTRVHDLVAPVEVTTLAGGRVRWTLQLAGDMRDRWADLAVALRDWSAPAERGLAVVPLWQVEAPAWRAPAAAGPVVLIATLRDGSFLALAAMPRVDGDLVELAPIGVDDEFPPAASVAGLDLAIHAAMASAGAPLALRGGTQLDITDPGDAPPAAIAVAFDDGTRWQPIDVLGSLPLPGGGRRYELDRAYVSLFPEGLPAGQRVRLCTATTALATPPAGAAGAATPHTLRLRLPGTGWAGQAAATAAVFHTGGFAPRAVLDVASPPKPTSDALVVELAIGAGGLADVFDASGALRWSRLDLAQRWHGLHADALVAQPLRIALGETPYPLAPGDIVALGFADQSSIHVAVISAGNDGVRLDTLATLPPTRIQLYGLRTQVAPADYAAALDLAPSSLQPPWLLSFSTADSPPSLLATVLPYDAAPTPSADGARLRFRFSHGVELVDIFLRAGDPDQPLYLFTNQRDELRSDFYTGAGGELADDLAHGPPPAPINFLAQGGSAQVLQLVLTASSWAVRQLAEPRPALVGSIRWKPAAHGPRMPADQFPELRIASADTRRVPTGIVLQSSRFNSGNFIAGASLGAPPATAAAVIASALRVSAQPLDRSGNPISPTWTPVGYAPLEQLGHTGKDATGSVTAFENLTYDDAVGLGLLSDVDSKYAFSASFSPTGTCTLHFLFIDKAVVGAVRVRIEAQYDVDPGRTGSGLADPIYPLETMVVAFDPASQLALLGPGSLTPGSLLFVRVQQHPGATDHAINLQWTSVASVTGPVVDLASPIAYGPDAVTEPIAVTGVGKLTRAAQLDADYYATVAKAKLALPASLALPLRDRLPLSALRTAPDQPSLVSSLVPGDVVLVFDERWRKAWADRRGTTSGAPAAEDWREWPDRQHQAVVQRVDPDTGLVVLAAPLPDSVQIRWTYGAGGRLAPLDEDVAALRVLLHYRAPVQGPKLLAALGSGSAQKFARFTSTLDAGTGSAVVPVFTGGSAPAPALADGITTGNLEVLAFDPVKAAWSRWLRYDRLSRAGKKDPAVTLGFRPAIAGQVPVSVTFGDGITGQLPPAGTANLYLRSTQIGAASPWLAVPRAVRIVAVPAPGATPPTTRTPSLSLRLEAAAPEVLSGGTDLGSAQWRSSLTITVARSGGAALALREITLAEAAASVSGFVLVAPPDAPFGTLDAYLYTPVALAASPPAAQQAPGTLIWSLDPPFYAGLSDGNDLTLAAGATSLQLLSTTGLRTGSQLAMFHDDASPPDLVRIAVVDPPTWSATLVDPLPQVYDLARSFIRGNLIQVVQGVVETTTLGSSDGTTPSLRLPLQNRQPLLHVVDPDGAPEPDITVLVGGQRWTRVLDFTGQTPTSRVWRLDIDASGQASVGFGDGVQGAIPPAGRDTITATARLGDGSAGNLAAGAIAKLVSGNLAIRSTTGITPSAGGSAGDDPPAARDKAFAYTLPGERVVSADDCVRAAIGESGVINAALDPTAPDGTVRLVVAMEDRRVPSPADLTAIAQQVSDVMPAAASVALEVVPAIQTPVYLVIELAIADGFEPGDVFAAVTTQLGTGDGGLFAADGWEVGEPLRLGTLYDALFQVAGVAHARVLWMAGTPLPDGAAPPDAAPDIFDPGPVGVVRCDSDPAGDPFGRSGTFRLVQRPEESP
ncbi:MAG TPA: baseplate J/gp47 family protein, partial [Kofleriaceae bacterium]|nr:baseplate J/gp47 family protein [Kofleriaceae bacterium]